MPGVGFSPGDDKWKRSFRELHKCAAIAMGRITDFTRDFIGTAEAIAMGSNKEVAFNLRRAALSAPDSLAFADGPARLGEIYRGQERRGAAAQQAEGQQKEVK